MFSDGYLHGVYLFSLVRIVSGDMEYGLSVFFVSTHYNTAAARYVAKGEMANQVDLEVSAQTCANLTRRVAEASAEAFLSPGFIPVESYELLSDDDFLALSEAFRERIQKLEGRSFVRIKIYRSPGVQAAYFVCSRYGKPPVKLVKFRDIDSQKCECMAKFSLSRQKGLQFELEHAPNCSADDDEDAATKNFFSTRLKDVVDFDTSAGCTTYEEYLIQYAVGLLKGDYSIKMRNVRSQVLSQLASKNIANPPSSAVESILRRAYMAYRGNVNIKESIKGLFDRLKEMKAGGRVEFQIAENAGVLNAIYMHVKDIAHDHSDECAVYTADVTYGLVDGRCGLTKTSFISSVSPSHLVRPLVVSLVKHEDQATFIKELLFLKAKVDPGLESRRVIFLIDGDRGRIAAIRSMLPLARIYLCLWHKEENIKKHVGPALAARRKASGGATVAELRQELLKRGVHLKRTAKKLELEQALEAAETAGLVRDVTVGTTGPTEAAEAAGPVRDVTVDATGSLGAAEEGDHDDEDAQLDALIADQDDEEESPDQLPPLVTVSQSSSSAAQPPTSAEPPITPVARADREEDMTKPFPEINSFNPVTAKQVFKWLREGVDHRDTAARLKYLAQHVPSISEYVLGELVSTEPYWADWARIWGLTFGLVSSTMQENLHWSLKSQLRGNCVFPHHFIDFLIKTLSRRQLIAERKRKSSKTFDNLQRDLTLNGYKTFVEVAQMWTTLEAQDHLYQELDMAQAYEETIELFSREQVMENLPLQRRGASANRFAMLMDQDEGALGPDGAKYYAVRHNALDSDAKPDIVCVTKNGSFACTCGDVAAMGAPDRHVFALLRKKLVAFSPKHHLHRHYWANKATPDWKSPPVTRGGFDVSACPSVSALASWDEATALTTVEWEVRGQGVEGYRFLNMAPSPVRPDRQDRRAAAAAAVDNRSIIKSFYHTSLELDKSDPTFLQRYTTFMTQEQQRQQDASQRSSIQLENGSTVQLPAPQPKGSSKRLKGTREIQSTAAPRPGSVGRGRGRGRGRARRGGS